MPSGGGTLAYTFAGYRYDQETGLYYVKARYYSPTLGRFLQADPAGVAGGTNLYAYVGNDPINLIDATGLCGQQNTGQVVKGGLQMTAAGFIVAGIATSPETGGLGAAIGVLGALTIYGNGLVNVLQGTGTIGSVTAAQTQSGISVANNPIAANALIVTDLQTAEDIGNVTGVIGSGNDLQSGNIAQKSAAVQAVLDAVDSGINLAHKGVNAVGNAVQGAWNNVKSTLGAVPPESWLMVP
jgi:RHS repeat-associated protein